MHRCRHTPACGQALILVIIVLALLAGGFFYLLRSKQENEKAARDFAQDAATRMMLQQDERFLDRALALEAQVTYPPSWRSRLFTRIRDLGPPPDQPITLTGSVEFTSGFFDPKGRFRAQISYPENPAYLLLNVSHPRALWQIDAVNFIWTPHAEPPPPEPTPEASIPITPSPAPSPSETPKRPKKRAPGAS